MRTITRGVAAALAAAAMLVAVGCAKDETVTASSTTAPVTASSSGGGSGTTAPDDDPTGTTDPDDKDKGSGEYAEACTAIEDLEALDEASDDEDSAATFALMEEARDAGPEELVDHWDTLIGVLEELDALGDSDEAMTRALELFDDPDFIEAAGAIDDFASDECGIEIDLDPSDQSPGGRTGDDEIGAPTDSTEGDDDPTSIDAVQAHVQSRFGTEDWYPLLDENVGWGSSGSSDVTWSISLGDDPAAAGATTTDLVDVCEVLAAYLDTYEDGDVEIEITGPDDAVIVSRAAGKSCVAA